MYFILSDEKDRLQVIAEKLNADCGLFKQCFELNEQLLLELTISKFKRECDFAASDKMKELGLTMPFIPVQELMGSVDSPPLAMGFMRPR